MSFLKMIYSTATSTNFDKDELDHFQSGENKIELHFFDETVDFVLYYNVPTIKKYVRPIYIKPCDDSGMFQVILKTKSKRVKVCMDVRHASVEYFIGVY